MWRTSVGTRVLAGAEAVMFRRGLASLFEYLESDADFWRTGVTRFDRLSPPERLAALDQTATALLDPEAPAPKHTAVAEAAIAAVYRHIEDEVVSEIDAGGEMGSETRNAVRAAALALRLSRVPSERSKDASKWNDVLERLRDRVFWDRDWEGDYVDADAPPEVAEARRADMDIDADYYTAAPPDPNPAQLSRIVARLRTLCDEAAP